MLLLVVGFYLTFTLAATFMNPRPYWETATYTLLIWASWLLATEATSPSLAIEAPGGGTKKSARGVYAYLDAHVKYR
jgi:hypothetical protein